MVNEPALPEEKPDVISQLINEKERLSKLLQIVKDRIAEIKSEHPYTMKSLVQSPEKIETRKAELEASIKQLNETLVAYTAKIEEMLR
jgi:predicted  nucleic acid-binding Zn-ribbon protein